jgi:exonuclease III
VRVVTWNLRRATRASRVWDVLTGLNPDLALLQEVSSIPSTFSDLFDIKTARTIGRNGRLLTSGTAVCVKGRISGNLPLSSEHDWVNQELKRFEGNFLSGIVRLRALPAVNVVSAYSPAWPVDTSRYPDVDITPVKLKQNPKVWPTEVLWSALKNADLTSRPWIVGGDLNISETFDLTFGKGNREILDRMDALGFTECLRKHQGKLTPTFRNTHGGRVVHQIDHLFVSEALYSTLETCKVGDASVIFEESLSDHLPIVADFNELSLAAMYDNG